MMINDNHDDHHHDHDHDDDDDDDGDDDDGWQFAVKGMIVGKLEAVGYISCQSI